MRRSAFFEDVPQIDITIDGQPSKSPVFVFDASCISACFPARYRRLRELMPNPCYIPARLASGLGALAITCWEYGDTDTGSYRQVAIAIPLTEAYFRAHLSGRALMSARRPERQHAFIRHLSVPSEVAPRGGVDFDNFPKFIADIEFSQTDEHVRCSVAEGQEHILTLSGKRISTPRSQRIDVFFHVWLDGQPHSVQLKVNQLRYGSSSSRDAAALELGGRHPIALELGRLLVALRPRQYEYCPQLEAILFGPERLTPRMLQHGLQAIEAVTGVGMTR